MDEDPRKSIQTDLHNALADAYYQAKCVQKVNSWLQDSKTARQVFTNLDD